MRGGEESEDRDEVVCEEDVSEGGGRSKRERRGKCFGDDLSV